MTAVAVVAHHEREVAAELAAGVVEWLVGRDHEAWVVPDDAPALRLDELVSERPIDGADLVVCLGGDGTMLRAVRLLDGAPVPLLGVNVGVLGYLTEIEPPALTSALERFIAGPVAGAWHLDERMMLQVSADGSPRWRVAGAQRGRGAEARVGAHGAAARQHRRRGVHELRRRRSDRRHADGVDGVLAVGSGPGRVAQPAGDAADAGVAAHVVRPHPRARPERGRRDRGGRASARPSWPSTARSSPPSPMERS